MNIKNLIKLEAGAPVLIPGIIYDDKPTPEIPEYKRPETKQQTMCVPKDLSRPNAINTEFRFLQNHKVYTYGQDIYVNNGSYYKRCSKQEVACMMADECPDYMAQAKNKKFLISAADGLFYNSSIRLDHVAQPPTLVPFMNCLIDTVSGRFVQPEDGYFLSYRLNANYIPYGECPNFDRFLYESMGGDFSLIVRVWRMIGYLLTLDNRGKVIFILQGYPNTGKSLLCNLIQSYYPPYMLSHINIHDLGERFLPSQLEEKALCISSDMPASQISERVAGQLKCLTGKDTISADVKFGQLIDLCNQARFVLVTNHPLKLRVDDPALLQRIVPIPFLYPAEHIDYELFDKIMRERDVIASRAIREYLTMIWNDRNPYDFGGQYVLNLGMEQPRCDMAALETNMEAFVQCHIGDDPDQFVLIIDAWNQFCQEYGYVYINVFSSCFRRIVSSRYTASSGKVQDHAAIYGVKLV